MGFTTYNHPIREKTMKATVVSKVSFAIVLAAILAAPSITAQAQVISWSQDVYGFDGANGGSGLPVANNPAGVVLAVNWNDTWAENFGNVNSGGVTVNHLYNNAGVATSLNLTYGAFNGNPIIAAHAGPDADGSYNREMLNGYLNAGPAAWGPPITNSYVSLNSIPYAQYKLYVYFSSDVAGRIGNVTDGTTTYDFATIGAGEVNGPNAVLTQTTDTTGAYPSADYAVFTGLTGSSQTITCNALGGNDQWLGIAAFQVVATPEPGTLALVAMGGIGILAFGRRFKAPR
jgi:hypothetical protein